MNLNPADFQANLAATGLKPPRRVYVMITDGCNLSCRHCWPQSVPLTAAVPVPTDAIRGLVDDMIPFGITEICFTGGEPLTHPEWRCILGDAAQKEEITCVSLQTNATRITQGRAGYLATLPRQKLEIVVSLDGAGAPLHDRIRGEGNYHSAIKGVERLVGVGLGSRVTVHATETRANIPELPGLLEWVARLGLGRFTSGAIVLGGRAAWKGENALPTPAQYLALLDRYHDDHIFRARYDRLGRMAALEWFKGRDFPATDACTCIHTPYVTAAGVLFPCIMLPIAKWGIAHAFTRPFGEVLMAGLERWRSIPQIYRRRRRGAPACDNCPGLAHCAGGCPGRLGDVPDAVWATEDRCALRKAVYAWRPGGGGRLGAQSRIESGY